MASEKRKVIPPGLSSQVSGNKKIHQYFDFAQRPASSSSLGANDGATASSALNSRVLPYGQNLTLSQSHAPALSSGNWVPDSIPSSTKSSSERVFAHPGSRFSDVALARRSVTPNRVEDVRQSQNPLNGVGGEKGSPIQIVVGSKPVNKDDFMVVAERRLPSPGETEYTAPKKARKGGKGSRSGTSTPAELATELERLPPKRSRPVEGKMAVPKMRDEGWSTSTTAATGEGEAPKRKKGRPPGSKNKVAVVAGAISSGAGSREVVPGMFAPDGTPMNRRGRPRGWKPGMSYDDLRPSDLNAKPRRTGGRGGRRPKMSILQIHHHMNVPFTSYVCEWKGCTAELHNLDTLRRHVKIIHLGMGKRGAKREGSRECLWGKCGHSEASEKKAVGDVLKHMEKKHFIPLAWHAGDGPRNSLEVWEKLVAGFRAEQEAKKNTLSGREQRAVGRGEADINESEGAERERERRKKLPRWLFDEYGNQVTESVEGQRLENAAEIKARRKRVREWEERCMYTSGEEDEEDGEGKGRQEDGQEVMGDGRE